MFNPPLNLADYMGLEMRVRTSNHGFIFNIHPDNMVPSDLFQGFIVIPHRDWAIIQLPFSNMAYTGYGYLLRNSRLNVDIVRLIRRFLIQNIF